MPGETLRLQPVEMFEAFYRREYHALVALAFALSGSRGHAEDIAQEALIAAYKRWDEISAFDHPSAWVRRVCANIAISVVRRRLVEGRAVLRLAARPTEVETLDDADTTFWAEVRQLPRRQAQCVALRYVYGCSVADIAEVVGCAEGTVKAHLARGRSRLAERLGEELDPGEEVRQ